MVVLIGANIFFEDFFYCRHSDFGLTDSNKRSKRDMENLETLNQPYLCLCMKYYID